VKFRFDLCLFCLLIFTVPPFGLFAPSADAATLQVGPGKPFATPCAAIAVAAAGDRIEIDATGNYAGDVCQWSTSNLTIVGVGTGRVLINAAGNNSQGKGTWVISGNDTTVENIEFTGSTVPDMNGAGIRQEGNNLTVRNCYFHDNQNGILSGGGNSTILIEFSEFFRNGAGDGFSHNLYIGNVTKLIFRYNYSHGAVIGHLLKSRAAENDIYYNRLTDESTGTASYEVDLPNGGLSFIVGNLIEKGPLAQNSSLVANQEEGLAAGNPDHELFVVNNTMVNDLGNGTFVVVDPSVTVPAIIKNNIFQGAGSVTTQGTAVKANNFSGNAGLANPASFDYHLLAGSPAIDAGTDAGQGGGVSLTSVFQYVHPSCAEGRTTIGAAIDIGAYEFNGGNATPPPNAPPRCGAPAPPAPVVSLSANSLTFAEQILNTTSPSQSVTLTNTGNATLTISGIVLVGTNPGDFNQTTWCGTTLAAGANCSITVTFTPTASGSRSATVSVTDNAAGSPHSISLSGSGVLTGPAVALSPTSLTFSSLLVGSTSPSQAVTLTNTGGAALAITGVTVGGDFSQTNSCGTSLAAAASCTINVSFKPSAGGSRTGSLSISDNAVNSPQTASLSGTGMDFSLSASSITRTINAGQSAEFTVVISPNEGFNQAISFTCVGAPRASTCTVTPASVTPSGTGTSVSVSITTTARGFAIPGVRPFPPFAAIRLILAMSIAAAFLALVAGRRGRVVLAFSSALLLVTLASGCAGFAGGGSQTPPPSGTGTPAGTFTLTVTGTSGNVSQSIAYTLKVN